MLPNDIVWLYYQRRSYRGGKRDLYETRKRNSRRYMETLMKLGWPLSRLRSCPGHHECWNRLCVSHSSFWFRNAINFLIVNNSNYLKHCTVHFVSILKVRTGKLKWIFLSEKRRSTTDKHKKITWISFSVSFSLWFATKTTTNQHTIILIFIKLN